MEKIIPCKQDNKTHILKPVSNEAITQVLYQLAALQNQLTNLNLCVFELLGRVNKISKGGLDD